MSSQPQQVLCSLLKISRRSFFIGEVVQVVNLSTAFPRVDTSLTTLYMMYAFLCLLRKLHRLAWARNPSLSKSDIETFLRDYLGVERVLWLGQGAIGDADTDGHVDNLVAFVRPGEVRKSKSSMVARCVTDVGGTSQSLALHLTPLSNVRWSLKTSRCSIHLSIALNT